MTTLPETDLEKNENLLQYTGWMKKSHGAYSMFKKDENHAKSNNFRRFLGQLLIVTTNPVVQEKIQTKNSTPLSLS